MDPAILSALSGLLGSLAGATASIATTWLNQHGTDRRNRLSTERSRREALYGDFINECSKLLIDALDHSLRKPEVMVSAYSLLNRIKLLSSPRVVLTAEAVIQALIAGYFRKNLTRDQIRDLALQDVSLDEHPLSKFSQACREELASLQNAT